jgi:tellurite resistance protein TerC
MLSVDYEGTEERHETDASVWLWFGFLLLVALLLYIDLFSAGGKGSPLRQAVQWTIAYVVLALLFCCVLGFWFSFTTAQEFLAGYLIEKSLSVDNLFVMIMLFKMFRVKKQHQRELLVWGILGAIILRAAFILTGSWIIHHFWFAVYVFGALLVFAAVKMLLTGEDDESEPPAIAKFLKRILPWDDGVDLDEDGASKFFVRGKHDKKLRITPQFACLIAIEAGDIIFAVDSIPAIFAVTEDPFVVFTSNIFAILGLRAMFFVISSVLSKFEYLQLGLAAILGFVGVKMLIAHWLHIPTWLSLLVIIGILAVVALASKCKSTKHAFNDHSNVKLEGFGEDRLVNIV